MMTNVERRASGTIEARAIAETNDAPHLRGYAAIFNAETVIAGLFRELVRPGAFAAAILRDDVRALWNHDPNYVLGRTKAGTLSLHEDEIGLRYDVTPPQTQWAQDLIESVARGDVSQSSFAFLVTKDQWEPSATPEGLPLRYIEEVQLFDVSPVTYPAYDATSVAARSTALVLQQVPADLDTARRVLRDRQARWRTKAAQFLR